MMHDPQHPDSDEEEALERLLGAVGPRHGVPADVTAEVRESVHAEWRAAVLARHRRRRVFAYGLAASGVVAMLATLAMILLVSNRAPVATVARVTGTLEATDAGGSSWHKVAAGEPIAAGTVLRAGVDGRAALLASTGIQVRMDADSLVAFDRAERLTLTQGAVYVDANPATTHDVSFDVITRFGSVSHVGTQFEVRNRGRFLEINVREGSVRLHSDAGEQQASAGERLRVSDTSVERTHISLQDPMWQWALQAAPEFTIEGVPLLDFLHWVARETGRKLVFATPQAAETARQVILHGSIGGLPPDAALLAVLSTTQFTQTPVDGDSIGITLKTR